MSSQACDKRPVVWIGAAGTGTAFGLAQSLRNRWGNDIVLVGADINPSYLVATSKLTDFFVTIPPVNDPDFPTAMKAGLNAYRVTVYVPILDEEIIWAADELESGGLHSRIDVIAPSAQSAHRCFDKIAAFNWMREVTLPTIETLSITEAHWAGHQLFAKPRFGRGSIGTRSVGSALELDSLKALGEDLIVQPKCEHPEVTVDAIRWPGGHRAVARERIEVKSGVCTKARVYEDVELSEVARRIGEGLGLRGAFCFQVMRTTPAGFWAITDINPRPGAGTRLSVAVGVDFYSAMVADRIGLPIEPLLPKIKHQLYVVRQYSEYIMTPGE